MKIIAMTTALAIIVVALALLAHDFRGFDMEKGDFDAFVFGLCIHETMMGRG